MRILLTGATGFLGKKIHNQLSAEHSVITMGRSKESTIQFDLKKPITSLPTIEAIVHVAGKAHSVPRTEEEVKEFYEINYEGTKRLCEALNEKKESLHSFIFISTVAVYGLEKGKAISEKEPLLGKSPYALSKIKAEDFLVKWGTKNNIKILILRLPLIFDFEAPGNLGNMIQQIKRKRFFEIGSTIGSKSIVYSEDIATHMDSFLDKEGIYNLTDGYHPNMNEIAQVIQRKLNFARSLKLPFILLKLVAILGDILGDKAPINSNKLKKLTTNLTFDDSKARKNLHWNPRKIIEL